MNVVCNIIVELILIVILKLFPLTLINFTYILHTLHGTGFEDGGGLPFN